MFCQNRFYEMCRKNLTNFGVVCFLLLFQAMETITEVEAMAQPMPMMVTVATAGTEATRAEAMAATRLMIRVVQGRGALLADEVATPTIDTITVEYAFSLPSLQECRGFDRRTCVMCSRIRREAAWSPARSTTSCALLKILNLYLKANKVRYLARSPVFSLFSSTTKTPNTKQHSVSILLLIVCNLNKLLFILHVKGFPLSPPYLVYSAQKPETCAFSIRY